MLNAKYQCSSILTLRNINIHNIVDRCPNFECRHLILSYLIDYEITSWSLQQDDDAIEHVLFSEVIFWISLSKLDNTTKYSFS